jgi:ABC-type multidrug transport system fused ATPase/permease subunit
MKCAYNERINAMKLTLKRLVKYIKPYKSLLTGGLIFALIASVVNLFQPLVLKLLIDDVFSGKHKEWLGQIIVLYLFSYLLSILFDSLKSYVFIIFSNSIAVDIRSQITAKFHRLPISFLETKSLGQLISIAINDVSSVSVFYQSVIPDTASHLFRIFFSLPVLFFLDWKMSCILFAIVPLFWLAGKAFHPYIRSTAIAFQQSLGMASEKVNESIIGTVDIRKYKRSKWDTERSRNVFKKIKESSKKQFYPSNLSIQVLNLLYSLPLVLLYYWGGKAIFNGTLTIGETIAFIQYFTGIMAPINMLLNVNVRAQSSFAVAKSIFEFLDQDDEKLSLKSISKDYTSKEFIIVKNLSYQYGNGEMGLESFNAQIPLNKVTVIVGDNGTGKSTLAQLLVGLRVPTKGEIVLSSVHMKEIGYIPHIPYVFNGTIADNIRFGRTIDEVTIKEVCTSMGLHTFIESLALGYNTMIGPSNQNLSAGQLQRVALARVLAEPPSILILDEALSNIDESSQLLLLQTFKNNVDTLIYITHHREHISMADCMIDLQNSSHLNG